MPFCRFEKDSTKRELIDMRESSPLLLDGPGPGPTTRVPVRALTAMAVVAAVATMSTPGCGGPTGQFYVVHNQVPSAGCVIPASKDAPYQGDGVLDVRVPSLRSDTAYLLFPLLENDLSADGAGGVEPNRIALGGFEVDVAFVDGSAAAADFFATIGADPSLTALLHYQTPWSGSVDPAGGTTSTSTGVFPAETARRLRDGNVLGDQGYARVSANVRAFGDTLGGGITSDVFRYPIRICDGCLINSVTACPATGPVLAGGVCNPGQDAPVDCCTQGTDLVCPATTSTSSP
jgi:hypothetical protein